MLRSTRSGMRRPPRETVWALRDLDLEVSQGEIVGIIGGNGAGKTTLLKLLSRITEPTKGFAEIHGRLGSLLEVGTGFHPELTGRENIYLSGAIMGMTRQEINSRFDEIVGFAEISKFIDTPVKRYSSGMYVRLAFAVAAHLEPEVLLIDEVLAVGDLMFQRKCLGKMGAVAKEGRTVLFVSHNMAAVQALCGRGILLERGRCREMGPVENVVHSYVRNLYDESARTRSHFPVSSERYPIAINDCLVRIESNGKGGSRLRIELLLFSQETMQNVGVGIRISSINGALIALLGPPVANFYLDEVRGETRCSFVCEEIDRYLAGGDYVIGVWAARPNVEYLVRVDEAAIATLPPRDVFSSGTYFEALRYGIVPLPLAFSHENTESDPRTSSARNR